MHKMGVTANVAQRVTLAVGAKDADNDSRLTLVEVLDDALDAGHKVAQCFHKKIYGAVYL